MAHRGQCKDCGRELASNNTTNTAYDKKELMKEYNRARDYAAHVGNLGPSLFRCHGPGDLALVRNFASGRFENGNKHHFIIELKWQGFMTLVDNEGNITRQHCDDVIRLCSAWTVYEPNESAHKLHRCRRKKRNAIMQNIILQAIIDGKRRAEERGKVDLDFLAIGGSDLTMEEEMHKIMAKTQADNQSQDDYLDFTATMEEEMHKIMAKTQADDQSQDYRFHCYNNSQDDYDFTATMEEEMYKIMAKTQADDQSQDDYLNFTAAAN